MKDQLRYQFERYDRKKAKRSSNNEAPEWKKFLQRISVGMASGNKIQREHKNLLEDFETHLLSTIAYYESKIDKEKRLQSNFIVISLTLLFLVPLIVYGIGLMDKSSVAVQLTALITALLGLYRGFSQWIRTRNRLSSFHLASSNLKARVYSLEDKWHSNYRREYTQSEIEGFCKDLKEAIMYSRDVQREETKTYFAQMTIPDFDILGTTLATTNQLNKLIKKASKDEKAETSVTKTKLPPPKKTMGDLTDEADKPVTDSVKVSDNMGLDLEADTSGIIEIGSSVGEGGVNNPDDVALIRDRLESLGYTWAYTKANGKPTSEMIGAIKLFQAIFSGSGQKFGGNSDGLVEPGFNTLAWLNAQNAPRWEALEDEGIGFVYARSNPNSEVDRWGSHWLLETLRALGRAYVDLKQDEDAVIFLHELSNSRGGYSRGHGSHQTGIDVDIRLLKTNGQPGTRYQDADYDQQAARDILTVINAQDNMRFIWFNDPVLIGEGLCTQQAAHDNHIHIRISPPARIPMEENV